MTVNKSYDELNVYLAIYRAGHRSCTDRNKFLNESNNVLVREFLVTITNIVEKHVSYQNAFDLVGVSIVTITYMCGYELVIVTKSMSE